MGLGWVVGPQCKERQNKNAPRTLCSKIPLETSRDSWLAAYMFAPIVMMAMAVRPNHTQITCTPYLIIMGGGTINRKLASGHSPPYGNQSIFPGGGRAAALPPQTPPPASYERLRPSNSPNENSRIPPRPRGDPRRPPWWDS